MLKLSIGLSGSAFQPDPQTEVDIGFTQIGPEVARILRHLAGRFEHGDYSEGALIFDSNGNRVGEWELIP